MPYEIDCKMIESGFLFRMATDSNSHLVLSQHLAVDRLRARLCHHQFEKRRARFHATATHSISISNSIGHDATGTKLRAGGFVEKYLA